MPRTPSPHLFDEPDDDDTLSTRMLAEGFDDFNEADPIDPYADVIDRVRAEDLDW